MYSNCFKKIFSFFLQINFTKIKCYFYQMTNPEKITLLILQYERIYRIYTAIWTFKPTAN